MTYYCGLPHFRALAFAIVLATHCDGLAQDSASIVSDDTGGVRARALAIIAENYVDSVEIDSSFSVPAILSRLDPFSWYETGDQHELSMSRFNEKDFRYGVCLDSADGHVILTAVTLCSAADHAGFLPGDEILSINGQALHGNDSIADFLLLSNTSTVLELHRASSDSTWTVTIRKSLCERWSVPVGTMLDSSIGYIQINGFHRGTAWELERALEKLRARGMTALILDLRRNSGGYVTEAMRSLNLFIHSDTPIIRIVSRNARNDTTEALPDGALYPALPLAILVGNGTCSAAEIFSGVMQDLGRAIIVGQPSIGKSLVMRYFVLPNDDAMMLAMARYTLPTGRMIQRPYRQGVLIGGCTRDFGTFDNSAHLVDSDFAEAGCPSYTTARGLNLTGLCGIIPDYFVSQAFFFPDWLRYRIAGAAALYLRAKINSLLAITLDSFIHGCPMPQVLVDWVLDDIRAHDTSSIELLAPRMAWTVPQLIKAYVAYGVWSEEGSFQLWERHSATVRRAMTLLSKPSVLTALNQ